MRVAETGSALLLVVLAIPAAHAETVERSLPADAKGDVTIVNVAGAVTVEGWKQAEVQVKAELGSGVERLEFESEGKSIVIKVILPKGRSSSGASQLKVRIPEGSSLSINTVSADQKVLAVRGSQRLQAVSGSIESQQWGEELRVKTISGDVRLQGHEMTAVTGVETVSGDVTAARLAGEIALNTVTGDADITMRELARGSMRTTNGDLRLRTRLAREARFETEAVNGDVELLLGGPLDVDFDIETFNGDIDSCFGPKPARTRPFAPGNSLRFKQGEGNAKVRVKTLNGSVEICND
jgi:DUF4097 and DUF4098 domain-containing protein YvlB